MFFFFSSSDAVSAEGGGGGNGGTGGGSPGPASCTGGDRRFAAGDGVPPSALLTWLDLASCENTLVES